MASSSRGRRTLPDSAKESRGQLPFKSRKKKTNTDSAAINASDEVERVASPDAMVQSLLPLKRTASFAFNVKEVKDAARQDLRRVFGSPPVSTSKGHAHKIGGKRSKAVPTKKKSSSSRALPPKLSLLEEFYEAVEAAISLLRMRRQMCTFSAVCKVVESSTQRRFLPSHIAQMKHLMPEVVDLVEYTWWDAEEQCNKREFRVALLPLPPPHQDTANLKFGKSNQMVRRRELLHTRLVEFASTHSEDDVIPLAELPNEKPKAGLEAVTSFADLPSNAVSNKKKAEVELEDYVPLSLPTAFDPSQLKKHPRLPVVNNSHLPLSPPSSSPFVTPLFKRHFSRPSPPPSTVIDCGVDGEETHSQKTTAEASTIARSNPACVSVGSPSSSFKPSFSIRSCKSAVPSLTEAAVLTTPRKLLKTAESVKAFNTPTSLKTDENLKAFSTPVSDNALLKDLSSAKAGSTPWRTPCSILANPFMSPPNSNSTPSSSSTPASVISTRAALAAETGKGDGNLTAKRQNVIKSLRFGTPLKQPDSTPKRTWHCFELEGGVEEGSSSDSRVKRSLSTAMPPTLSEDELCRESESIQDRLLSTPAIAAIEDISVSDRDIIQSLPQELVLSVQAKERKALEDRMGGVEEMRKRQQLMGGLPHLCNMLRLFFQSSNRSVIPHKDLLTHILSSHRHITDRGEIEEQLRLLVELASDWLSTTTSSTGDLLFRIDRKADIKSVLQRLVSACKT